MTLDDDGTYTLIDGDGEVLRMSITTDGSKLDIDVQGAIQYTVVEGTVSYDFIVQGEDNAEFWVNTNNDGTSRSWDDLCSEIVVLRQEVDDTTGLVESKQDRLIPGKNISIHDNIISSAEMKPGYDSKNFMLIMKME